MTSENRTIQVNGQDVQVTAQALSGLQIREHAVAAGIEIQVDFELVLIVDEETSKGVSHTEIVEIVHGMQFVAKPPVVRSKTIKVNGNPVQVTEHSLTGLQIKEKAIAQGVVIQLDFVLMLDLGHHRTRQIADGEVLVIIDCMEFDAIPNDDHS